MPTERRYDLLVPFFRFFRWPYGRVLCRKDEARRLLAIFIPDVKGHVTSNFEGGGALECTLTVGAVLHQLKEVWFLAHLVGW